LTTCSALRRLAALRQAYQFSLSTPHGSSVVPGASYSTSNGKGWHDNAQRFAALSWIAAEIALGRLLNWRPDVLHANDWHAALAPAYMVLSGLPRPATMLTVHNIAFQGVFPASLLPTLRLPSSAFAADSVEYYGNIGFLKAGLYFADHITTVSPTYSSQVTTRLHCSLRPE
jgi:starch synthase